MKILNIKGGQNLIQEIEHEKIDGMQTGRPIAIKSPSDALDSPLNPGDIIDGVELIKLAFETAAAGVTFFTALIKLLKEKKGKVVVSDDNKSEEVTEDSNPDELVNKFL